VGALSKRRFFIVGRGLIGLQGSRRGRGIDLLQGPDQRIHPFAPRGATNEGDLGPMSNTTTLSGNLTRDPEIRYTREGQANATFGLAVNRRWQPRGSQEWEEATSFFDVVCWRELAENVALSLVKGSRVVVTGRLEQHTWETENGERRSRVEVTAEDVGASLRFATAEITRVERRSPDQIEDGRRSDKTDAVDAEV